MVIRRNASRQEQLDEWILKMLDKEPWSTPKLLAAEVPLDATENQIRDRCKPLADAELIDVDFKDCWRVELTGLRKRYLKGETDMAYQRRPRWIQAIDEKVLKGK